MMMPLNTEFSTWAASLVIDYPKDNIPLFTKGMDWRLWGNFLIQEQTFEQNGCPSTQRYSDPMVWARDVYRQMVNT
jgi:hypothetical protein